MSKRVLTLFFTLIAVAVNAQIPKKLTKCEVGLPRQLNQVLLKESDMNKFMKSADFGQSNTLERYWNVFSDREGNVTYQSPSTSAAKYTTLKFGEELRIAKISGQFALVYAEPQYGVEYPAISSSAVCKGWVPMSKLLLWHSCLASDSGIYNKALLCVNLDEVNSNTDSNIGIGYRNPETKSHKGRLTADMNFYFIMKRENGMALLAKQDKMEGTFTNDVLECWVPSLSYVPWNQRSCAEPTWEPDDVMHFAGNDIKIKIYKNEKLEAGGESVADVPFEKKKCDAYYAPEYFYRVDGKELRYPILDGTSKDIYNISTFAANGGNPSAKSKRIEADERKMKVLEKMQRINLALVIDGTKSMEPYYPKVKEAIAASCATLAKDFDIRVGAVIYRDYEDEKDGGLVEICPLKNAKRDLDYVNKFLDQGEGFYGIRSARADLSPEEALYYGINKALDTLRFRDGENNMMLVIGDCGNHMDDTKCPTQEEIVKKLVDKKISLMGFQVKNTQSAAYDAFNIQMLTMVRECLTQQYKRLNAAAKVSAKPLPDGFDYSAGNVSDQFFFGSYRCQEPGVNEGVMAPERLADLMQSEIGKAVTTIKNQMSVIANAGNEGFVVGNPQPGLINVDEAFIKERLGADWKKLIAAGQVVNFMGYTPKKDDHGRSYCKPVIFISASELTTLLQRLEKVYQVANEGKYTEREQYIEAMKALVRSLAPGMTPAQMAQMGNADISAMVGGLNESTKSLNEYTLEQLSDEQSVPQAKYRSILNNFKRKYENLERIASTNYKYVKDFNGAKYYWIPIDKLP